MHLTNAGGHAIDRSHRFGGARSCPCGVLVRRAAIAHPRRPSTCARARAWLTSRAHLSLLTSKALAERLGKGRSVTPKPRCGRYRSIEELTHDSGERFWLLVVQVVPASLEHRDLNTVDELREGLGVTHRDHTIALPPDDGDGRKRVDFVCTLPEPAPLPAPVDDVTDRASEGTSRAGARVHGGELGEIVGRKDAAEREPSTHAEEGLAEVLDDEGDRGQAQQRRDFAAKASRRGEHEPPDAVAALQEEHLRDPAAQRVPDDVRLGNTGRLQPSRGGARVPWEVIRGIRTLGQTVPWEVGHDHTPIARQRRGDTPPCPVAVLEPVDHDDGLRRLASDLGPMHRHSGNACERVPHLDIRRPVPCSEL